MQVDKVTRFFFRKNEVALKHSKRAPTWKAAKERSVTSASWISFKSTFSHFHTQSNATETLTWHAQDIVKDGRAHIFCLYNTHNKGPFCKVQTKFKVKILHKHSKAHSKYQETFPVQLEQGQEPFPVTAAIYWFYQLKRSDKEWVQGQWGAQVSSEKCIPFDLIEM